MLLLWQIHQCHADWKHQSSRELSEIPTGSLNRTQWVTYTQDQMWKARMALFPYLVSLSLYKMSWLLHLISWSLHLTSQPIALTPLPQLMAQTSLSLGLMVMPLLWWIRLGVASPSSNFLVGSVHPIVGCVEVAVLANHVINCGNFFSSQYPLNVMRSPNHCCIMYTSLPIAIKPLVSPTHAVQTGTAQEGFPCSKMLNFRHLYNYVTCVEVTAGGGKELRGKKPPLQVYILNRVWKHYQKRKLNRSGNIT